MPDITGLRVNTTYIVTYTEVEGHIDENKIKEKLKKENEVWYDYNNQRWANIVVKGNGKTAYFVYVPRYIYKLDTVREETEVKFVGTDIYRDKIRGMDITRSIYMEDRGR